MKDIGISFLVAGLAGAFLTGCTGDSGNSSGIDQQRLDLVARAIVQKEGLISAADLADRLIVAQGAPLVMDLRNPREFAAASIRGSANADIPTLLTESGRSELTKVPEVVLVSASGVEAAQTAALLRATGVTVSVLQGGFEAWQRYLENPEGAPADAGEAREMAKRQATACWFEGDYVAAAGLVVKTPDDSATRSGGYVPPLEPVQAPEAPAADPLGLGLGLGLGPEDVQPHRQRTRKRLRIGEGC